MRQSSDAWLRQKEIAGYGPLFYHKISGYGPPMRQSSDDLLRQKEISDYGPLQSSDQWEAIRAMSHWSELWRCP